MDPRESEHQLRGLGWVMGTGSRIIPNRLSNAMSECHVGCGGCGQGKTVGGEEKL